MSESRPHGCLRVCFALCLLLLCGGQAKAGQATLPDEFLAVQRFALTVQADPADATVKVLNIGPKYHDGILLEPGRYTVQVSRPGYVTKTLEVIIVDQDLTWGVSLATAPDPEPVVPAPEPAVPAPEPTAPPSVAQEPSPPDPQPAVEPGPAQPPQAVADAVSSPADFKVGVQPDVAQARYDQLLPDADLVLHPGDDLKKELALAKKGALVLLEPGAYLVSGKLKFKKDLHLVGPGPQKVVVFVESISISFPRTTNYNTGSVKWGGRFEIEGISFAPSHDSDSTLLWVQNTILLLRNCIFYLSKDNNVEISGGQIDISCCASVYSKKCGIYLHGNVSGNVHNNVISNNNVGIQIKDAYELKTYKNITFNNSRCGMLFFDNGEYTCAKNN